MQNTSAEIIHRKGDRVRNWSAPWVLTCVFAPNRNQVCVHFVKDGVSHPEEQAVRGVHGGER